MFITATHRLTDVIIEDQVAEPLRQAAWKIDPEMKHVGYLVTCPRCTSVWAGMAVATATAIAVQRRSFYPLIPVAALYLSQKVIDRRP